MINTKIIATIGPACDNEKTLMQMYDAGMRIARLNFSHGNHSYFETAIEKIRKISNKIAIIADTKGPEIRSGEVEGGEIELCDEDKLLLTKKNVIGTNKILTINYHRLGSLKKGDRVLIDDGLIEAKVISRRFGGPIVKIVNGGKLGSRKTVSLKGHNAKIDFLSEKDKSDINFAIRNKLDFVAASFVRKGKDVLELQKYLDKHNSNMKIISKIEHWEALENIDSIIENSYGIMVARGDLGVEVEIEKVPQVQKDIILKCNELGKPVIVATQMLESMRENPRPTRAEIADVTQAILDGTDAIMLSAETASGDYPVKAVNMMTRIAKEYEMKIDSDKLEAIFSKNDILKNSISIFVARTAYLASKRLRVSAIITPTESGFTARNVSRFKPKCPIFAITHNETIIRQLQLSWGVFPYENPRDYKDVDRMVKNTIRFLHKEKLITDKCKVAITSGHNIGMSGHTNTLEIYRVENVLKK